MPLYEYDCEKCGTFEVKQKMNDEPLASHPECGAKATRRISLTSFALKGGGWYADGYASSGSASQREAAPACGAGGCGAGACGVA